MSSAISGLSIVDAVASEVANTFVHLARFESLQICRWNFDNIYHTFGNMRRLLPVWVTTLLFPVVGRHRN